MKKLNVYIFVLLLGTITYACSDSTEEKIPDFNVVVINQGQFTNGNASLTTYSTHTEEVNQNQFQLINERPLGDVAQSATLINGQLVIVVNNSHKLEILNPETLESIKTVTLENGTSPRNIAQAGNRLFMTTYTDNVIVMNANFERIGTVPVGARTEGIAVVGNNVIVAESFFADFTSADHLSVINSGTLEISRRVELRSGPSTIHVDNQNRIWVSTTGNWGENNGAIYVLNGTTFVTEKVIELEATPGAFTLSNLLGIGFVSTGNQTKSINMDNFELGETVLETGYYSLGIFGKEGLLFAGDAKDFAQSGSVSVYAISGNKTTGFSAGLIPGGFFFIE